MKDRIYKIIDLFRYKRILDFQDKRIKEFYDVDGCGLEIEFGIVYERKSRVYIETGLRKIKSIVGNKGKFVTDLSIGKDINVEIVLKPFDKEDLKNLFNDIKEVIAYYENLVFDENCGVHANFRGDDTLKREFYYVLVNGGYDSEKFVHSKYKTDFMDIVKLDTGETMSYEGYIDYQKKVAAKYVGINFLKDNLIEVRILDLNWDHIEYVIDLYEKTKSQLVSTKYRTQ